MEDVIERRHFAVGVIVLDGYINLKQDIIRMMCDAGLDEHYKKRILVLLSLVGSPQTTEWDFDKFLPELSNLTRYLLHKLVLFKDQYIECCIELERRMKAEWKAGILGKVEYLYLRRCYFELRRILERLDVNDHYNISYTSENHMKIIYHHI